MPRYSLKRSPCWKTTSPGASSVPASIEPSMTVSAPAAIAFATSPDDVIPPSAITGTPCRAATSATSWIAVTCGTPTPATTASCRSSCHALSAIPGPDPDLHRVGAGVDQRLGRLGGRDVAGDHLELAGEALDPRDHLDHAARVAVRRVDDEHVGARRDQRLRALERVRADADRGADAQPALRVLRRERELDPLLDVLDRDQALEHAVGVDDGQLLDPVAVQELLGLLERRPDRRGDEALARSSPPRRAATTSFSKRRSRFVRMPTRRPSSSVIGTPEMW